MDVNVEGLGFERPVETLACATCSRPTAHEIQADFQTSQSFEDGNFTQWDNYRVVRCRGCGHVAFQHQSRWSEDLDERGEPEVTERMFSPNASGRPLTESSKYFPTKVRQIYKETVRVLNVSALHLAALGVRTLVEAVCIDAGCSPGPLIHRIDELVTKGILSKRQAEFLHLHRALGNEAAHEIEAPPQIELEAGVDIVENLLQTMYRLPQLANEIEQSRGHRGR
jgi:hypothetical protein